MRVNAMSTFFESTKVRPTRVGMSSFMTHSPQNSIKGTNPAKRHQDLSY
jgi:hypothetical protein